MCNQIRIYAVVVLYFYHNLLLLIDNFLKSIKFTDDAMISALINLFVSGIFMLIIFYIGLYKNLKKLIEQK